MLMKAVAAHGSVLELDLSYNIINDDGICCLAEYIKVCTSLVPSPPLKVGPGGTRVGLE